MSSVLQLPAERIDATFREGFWQWADLLAAGDFQAAHESVRWAEDSDMTAEKLEERIATFFNDKDNMVPIVPNERLVGLINGKMEIEWDEEDGWGRALVPVSNEPKRAKEDDVSLMGIAVSFFVVAEGEHQVLEFERFHV